MTAEPPINWPARQKRAEEHTKRLMQECEEARKKGRTPRYIPYDYREEPPGALGGGHQ